MAGMETPPTPRQFQSSDPDEGAVRDDGRLGRRGLPFTHTGAPQTVVQSRWWQFIREELLGVVADIPTLGGMPHQDAIDSLHDTARAADKGLPLKWSEMIFHRLMSCGILWVRVDGPDASVYRTHMANLALDLTPGAQRDPWSWTTSDQRRVWGVVRSVPRWQADHLRAEINDAQWWDELGHLHQCGFVYIGLERDRPFHQVRTTMFGEALSMEMEMPGPRWSARQWEHWAGRVASRPDSMITPAGDIPAHLR
eukprot:g14888.t1